MKPYHLVIDFETANPSPTSACSIGLVVLEEYKIVHEAMFLIRPPTSIFHFTGIHGITWQKVKNEPDFKEVYETGIKPWYLKSKKLVAHNIGFDQRVLHASGAHYGIKIPRMKTECTVKLSRYQLGIKPANLANVSQTLGIELNHHEAHSDAKASAQIYIFAKTGMKPWEQASLFDALPQTLAPKPKKAKLDLDKVLALNSPKSAAKLKELLTKK